MLTIHISHICNHQILSLLSTDYAITLHGLHLGLGTLDKLTGLLRTALV